MASASSNSQPSQLAAASTGDTNTTFQTDSDINTHNSDDVLVLDGLEFFQATLAHLQKRDNTTTIDKKGWGRILMGSGWTQWMEKVVRAWWIVNKNNNLIKKG